VNVKGDFYGEDKRRSSADVQAQRSGISLKCELGKEIFGCGKSDPEKGGGFGREQRSDAGGRGGKI
jgi:hypothetical protein